MAVTRLGNTVGRVGTTSASWTGFTVPSSDANTVVVVAVNASVSSNATATCSVTYGGVTMKQLGWVTVGSSTNRAGAGIYYLFNPGTGAQTIVATPAGATIAKTRAVDVYFSGVSSIGQSQSVATMAHTVNSCTNGYALRALSNGSDTGTLGGPAGTTTEYQAGAAVGGVGDYLAVQSAPGADTVAFTASGTADTPDSVGCNLTPTGAINLVQIASSTTTSASSQAILMPGPNKVGNTIIACMRANPGANAITNVTDTKGNTYSVACPLNRNGTAVVTWVYYAPVTVAADAGANTVTATFAGSQTSLEIIAVEYDGLDPAAPLDQHHEATGTSTAYDSGNTPTTAMPTELIFGFGTTGGTTSAAGSGFIGRIVGTDTASSLVEDKVVSSTGAYNATGTTSSAAWCMNVATFKPSLTGTIAAAVKKATASLTGVEYPKGTIAAAGKKTTAALTGVEYPKGTIAAALAKALFSGSGTQTQTGSVAAILKKATASLTGAMQPTGTVSAASKKVTASFAATQIYTGTIAAAAKKTTGSATGAQSGGATTGTITAAGKKTAAALAGVQTQTGTIAATARKTVATFTGAMQPQGTLAAAVKKAAAALTVTQIYTGTIAAVAKKTVASLAATQKQTGTIAVTIKKMTAASAGIQIHAGTVAATVKKATAVLTGAMQPTGTVAATLKKTTASFTAIQIYTGTIAATKTRPTATLSGSMLPKGAIAATKTRPTAALSGRMLPKGTIAAALKKPSFAGISEAPGQITATTKHPLAALVGLAPAVGTINANTKHVVFTATAKQIQQGAITAVLRHAAMAAAGYSIGGPLAATLHKMLFTAAGTQKQQGTLAGHTQALVAAVAALAHPGGTITTHLPTLVFASIGYPGFIEGDIAATLAAALFQAVGETLPNTPPQRWATMTGAPRETVPAGMPRETIPQSATRTTKF